MFVLGTITYTHSTPYVIHVDNGTGQYSTAYAIQNMMWLSTIQQPFGIDILPLDSQRQKRKKKKDMR